jgi:hypothetical protein
MKYYWRIGIGIIMAFMLGVTIHSVGDVMESEVFTWWDCVTVIFGLGMTLLFGYMAGRESKVTAKEANDWPVPDYQSDQIFTNRFDAELATLHQKIRAQATQILNLHNEVGTVHELTKHLRYPKLLAQEKAHLTKALKKRRPTSKR